MQWRGAGAASTSVWIQIFALCFCRNVWLAVWSGLMFPCVMSLCTWYPAICSPYKNVHYAFSLVLWKKGKKGCCCCFQLGSWVAICLGGSCPFGFLCVSFVTVFKLCVCFFPFGCAGGIKESILVSDHCLYFSDPSQQYTSKVTNK